MAALAAQLALALMYSSKLAPIALSAELSKRYAFAFAQLCLTQLILGAHSRVQID